MNTLNSRLACGNRFKINGNLFALNSFSLNRFAVIFIALVLALTALPVSVAAASSQSAQSATSSGFMRVADGIEFSLAPVLKEVSAGTAGFQEIDLRNSAGVDLNVEAYAAVASAVETGFGVGKDSSGAPAKWISLFENKFVLLAGEKRVLNLAWSIPQDAVPGDYLITLTAQGTGGSSERASPARAVHSFLLRVKPASSPSSSSSPSTPLLLSPFSLSESVTADFEAGKLLVSLKLDNPSSEKTRSISVRDFPSGVFADEGNADEGNADEGNADEGNAYNVVFAGGTGTNGVIEKRSSGSASDSDWSSGFSVKWVLPDGLQAGESRSFSYSIPFNAADFQKIDFAVLGEWSAAAVELKASEQTPILSVTGLKASKATVGKPSAEVSVVEAKVFYAGNDAGNANSKTLKTLRVTAALEAPGFFSVSPQQTTLALEPQTEKTLFFNVTPSSATASGAYNLLFTVTSNDAAVAATATKTTLVVVENPQDAASAATGLAGFPGFWLAGLTQLFSFQSGSGYWLVLAAILVFLAVAAFIAFKRLKRLKLLRKEDFEDREGFLEQVKRNV